VLPRSLRCGRMTEKGRGRGEERCRAKARRYKSEERFLPRRLGTCAPRRALVTFMRIGGAGWRRGVPVRVSWHEWQAGDPGSWRDSGQEPLRRNASRSAFRLLPKRKERGISLGTLARVLRRHDSRPILLSTKGLSFLDRGTIHGKDV